MADLTQTGAQVQTDLNAIEDSNMGLDSITDGSDTQSTAAKKSGVHSLGATSSNAPTTDRAVMLTLARDADAASELRHAQVVITEPGNMYWAEENNGTLGNWQRVVSEDATQTLTNKALNGTLGATTPEAASVTTLDASGKVTVDTSSAGDLLQLNANGSATIYAYMDANSFILSNTASAGSARDGLRINPDSVVIENNGTAAVTFETGDATFSGDGTFSGDVIVDGFLQVGDGVGSGLTISSGAITATATNHRIDTEGAAATDNLVTINGGAANRILIINTVSSGRDVVIKHGTGNIATADGNDYTLDSVLRVAMLWYDGSSNFWRLINDQP